MNELSKMPPHPPTHTACSTPNPPWWCNEAPQDMVLDQGLIGLLVLGLIFGFVKIKNKNL